ncbi:MAG: hypothetical protein KatS3mg023_3885 [Armatimonadota bacterium]|nr:MAG: hypothetical protein KatS3mg023_3885 [Armatimonadota bacterium]
MFEVTVYRMDSPDGVVYVCTENMLQRLRLDMSDAAQMALKRYEEIVQHCRTEVYHLRPYTFGERLQAEWECTEWTAHETPRLNTGRMTVVLLAKCLGIEIEEVEKMHPQLGQLLWAELQHRCTPSPFGWYVSPEKPQSSETAETPKHSPK